MQEEEEPAVGAHGYEEICEDDEPVYVVVKGWGRGIRRVERNPGNPKTDRYLKTRGTL